MYITFAGQEGGKLSITSDILEVTIIVHNISRKRIIENEKKINGKNDLNK